MQIRKELGQAEEAVVALGYATYCTPDCHQNGHRWNDINSTEVMHVAGLKAMDQIGQ